MQSSIEHLADFPLKFMQPEEGKISSKKFSVKPIHLLLSKIVWGNTLVVDAGDLETLKGSHIQGCVCVCPSAFGINWKSEAYNRLKWLKYPVLKVFMHNSSLIILPYFPFSSNNQV